jgi:hypothetical protein
MNWVIDTVKEYMMTQALVFAGVPIKWLPCILFVI